jgi:hypothetical protein
MLGYSGVGGCVGPSAGQGVMERRYTLCPAGNRTPSSRPPSTPTEQLRLNHLLSVLVAGCVECVRAHFRLKPLADVTVA